MVIAKDDLAGTSRPPSEPRLRPEHAEWSFGDETFSEIPALRRWMADEGIDEVHEAGHSADREPLPPGELFGLEGTAWVPGSVGGAVTRRDGCPGCGLETRIVDPDMVAHLDRIPATAPLSYVTEPGCFVASSELVERLAAAGLAEGMRTSPVKLDGGRGSVIWAAEPVGGPAYPFGPTPCRVCGRASVEREGRRVFERPRYAFRLVFDPPPPGIGWVWNPVYGQQMPFVTRPVAEWLLEAVPRVRFRREGVAPDPDAFLPEDLR